MKTESPGLKYYEALATQLLEEWARQLTSRASGTEGAIRTPNVFNEHLAQSSRANNGPRRRTRRHPRTGQLIEIPYYPAAGKETRPSGNQTMPRRLVAIYNRMDRIMETIRHGTRNGQRYWDVLYLSYTLRAKPLVAAQMKCSESTVSQLKSAAMDHLVLLLQIGDKEVD